MHKHDGAECTMCESLEPTVQLCDGSITPDIDFICSSCWSTAEFQCILLSTVDRDEICPLCSKNKIRKLEDIGLVFDEIAKSIEEAKIKLAIQVAEDLKREGDLSRRLESVAMSHSVEGFGISGGGLVAERSASVSDTTSISLFPSTLLSPKASAIVLPKYEHKESSVSLPDKDVRGKLLKEYKIACKQRRQHGDFTSPTPTWITAQNIIHKYLPKRNALGSKKPKPKRMMAKAFHTLLGEFYTEKIIADNVDDRVSNRRADLPFFLRDHLVNKFGLASIANDMLSSFVDFVHRQANKSPRVATLSVLLGISHPELYSPLATDAFLDMLQEIIPLESITKRYEGGDGQVWYNAKKLIKSVSQVFDSNPNWSPMAHLKASCNELDLPCGMTAKARNDLILNLESLIVDITTDPLLEAAVSGEGSLIMDVDRALHYCVITWLSEYSRITGNLTRIRLLIENELKQEEDWAKASSEAHVNRPFEANELELIERGVAMFGEGNWVLILENLNFDGRRPDQLKAMWQQVLAGKVVQQQYAWDWETWHWDGDWEWDGLCVIDDETEGGDDWPELATHGPPEYLMPDVCHDEIDALEESGFDEVGIPEEMEEDEEDGRVETSKVADISDPGASTKIEIVDEIETASIAVTSSGAVLPPIVLKAVSTRKGELRNVFPQVHPMFPSVTTHGRISNFDEPGSFTGSRTLPVDHVRDNNGLSVTTDLSNYVIGDRGAIALSRTLFHDVLSPKSAAVRGPLSPRGGDEDGKQLHPRKEVGTLLLAGNGIGKKGAVALVESLIASPHNVVRMIDFTDNRIGREGVDALARLLSMKSCVLESLNLSGNRLSERQIMLLCDVLRKSNTSLTSLNLSRNEITNGEAIAGVISDSMTLKQLDVSWNALNCDSGVAIAHALERSRSLELLNLSFNALGTSAGIAMGEALKQTSDVLTTINLSFNKIGPKASVALAAGLMKNQILTELKLTGNPLGREGTRPLLQCLHERSKITGVESIPIHLGLAAVKEDTVGKERETFWDWCFGLISDPSKLPSEVEKRRVDALKAKEAKKGNSSGAGKGAKSAKAGKDGKKSKGAKKKKKK